MAVNISEAVIKNCVDDSVLITVDFNKYTGLKRKNLINALSGRRVTADEVIILLANHFKSPIRTTTGWRRIPSDSNWWEALKEVSAMLQLMPPPVQKKGLDRVPWVAKTASLRKSHTYNDWCFNYKEMPVMKHPHLKNFVLDIDKSHPVWGLIKELEAGNNPRFQIAVKNS
jgi:hypothetical protein